MYIRWIVYTRDKREAKDIIEDALSVIKDHMQRCRYLSAKPYWKFDDSYIVEMKLKLQDGSLDYFIKFLNGISECWHLNVDGGNSTDSSIIAADNCNEFINKKISWMWVEFDRETECGFFEELRETLIKCRQKVY